LRSAWNEPHFARGDLFSKKWKEPDPRKQTALAFKKWIVFFLVFELAGRLRTRLFSFIDFTLKILMFSQ